jgi:AcrR family transcriptional regulator
VRIAESEDVVARARIRDAAMQHFGEYGYDGATIRGIAATAGVSPGLLRHHFGSKQGLRDACDEHLIKIIRRLNDAAMADPTLSQTNHVASGYAALGPYQRYFARSLTEGGCTAVFDEMVGMCEAWLVVIDEARPDPPAIDRRVRATVITAMSLAVPLLREHVSRGIGADLASAAGHDLLARTLLDLYSHTLVTPAEAATALAGLDRLYSTTEEPRPLRK